MYVLKSIGELFEKAVTENSNINNLMVEEVKFSKKTNSVIIYVNIDSKINPVDIAVFENKAKEYFGLKSFKVKLICKCKNLELKEEDVINLISYIGHYHPYVNDMFKNCKITIENNKEIAICLDMPESKFLNLKRADNAIAKNVQTFFGIETNVSISDSNEALEKLKQEVEVKKKEVRKTELHIPANGIVNNGEVLGTVVNKKEENKSKISEKQTSVIYGKDISKDNIDKIDDVKQDDGKVCIKGQVITIGKRGLKNGKILLTLDVSDKTSTISCKAFLDSKKADEIGDRIREGNYVKV